MDGEVLRRLKFKSIIITLVVVITSLSMKLTLRLRIAQRGSEAAILLLNSDDGKLFAISPIKDGSVEKTKVLGRSIYIYIYITLSW